MGEWMTAQYAAMTKHPDEVRFRLAGSRVEWEEIASTPTRCRLRYWKSAFGAPWIMRPVTRYVSSDTMLERLLPVLSRVLREGREE
jgi:hypothetical protein